MKWGVTGSRKGATGAQEAWFLEQFDEVDKVSEIHHGACRGVDEFAHSVAVNSSAVIVVHPPLNASLAMSYQDIFRVRSWGIILLKAKSYHERDRNIVDADVDKLIALPDSPERRDSGTWYTIRYGVFKKLPVTICYPDGTVEFR